MIEHIPELVDAGIDSFKIEGRMKTALYVAAVARTYRRAIDDYFEDPALYEKNLDFYKAEIAKCTYRQFTTGFFFEKPTHETQIYDSNTYVKEYTYLGRIEEVIEENQVVLIQRNKFCVGDVIESMLVDGRNAFYEVTAILDEEGNSMESAPHPKQRVTVTLSLKEMEEGTKADLEKGLILRRKEE